MESVFQWSPGRPHLFLLPISPACSTRAQHLGDLGKGRSRVASRICLRAFVQETHVAGNRCLMTHWQDLLPLLALGPSASSLRHHKNQISCWERGLGAGAFVSGGRAGPWKTWWAPTREWDPEGYGSGLVRVQNWESGVKSGVKVYPVCHG